MTIKIMKAIFVKHAVCALLALFGVSLLKAAEIIVPEPFSDICGSGSNAVVCAVGDTVVLPEGEYTVNNSHVASISGNTVTALNPGFTGIIGPISAVGGLVVLPSVGGSGRVFVAIMDTTFVLTQAGSSREFQWCNPENWRCVQGSGDNAYPNGADDVAMIPVGGAESNVGIYDYNSLNINLKGDGNNPDITVGQIYLGNFMTQGFNCHFRGGASSGTMRFRRTDGKTPYFAFTGGAAAQKAPWLRFSLKNDTTTSALALDLAEGLTFDMGHDDSSSGEPRVFCINGSLSLPAGKRLLFVNGKPNSNGDNNAYNSGIQFEANFALGGAGTIRNDSDMNMRVDSEGSAVFAGTWEVCGRRGTGLGPNTMGAGIDFRKATAAGRTVLSEGGVKQVTGTGASDDYFVQKDVGNTGGIKIGSASSASHTGLDFYPERLRSVGHVILNSGVLGIWSEYGGGNGNADVITTRVDRLTLGYGLSKLFFYGGKTSEASISSNYVHIVALSHTNLAQVLYHTSDFWYDDGTTGTATNRMLTVKFDNLRSQAIGGVIPWMVGLSTRRSTFPPSIDENGFLYYDMPAVSATIAAASSDAPFVRLDNTHVMQEDKTLNAVRFGSMRYSGLSKAGFGAGRTLTIASGAIFLQEFSFVGDPAYETDAGTLVFGAPGYVFIQSGSADNLERRPRIHSAMTAPQGVAFAGIKNCGVVLTGDQTGIEKELVVNGTTVILGTNTVVNLDVDIRVAGGFSILDVQNVNANFLKKHTLTLQDSGNYPAKVNLAAGPYIVDQMYIAGKKMLSGTYGSTTSGAENVDDDHFSGEGMIMVASGAGLSVIIR